MTHEMWNAIGSVAVSLGGIAVAVVGWRLQRIYTRMLNDRQRASVTIDLTLANITRTQEGIAKTQRLIQAELDALYGKPIRVAPVPKPDTEA